MNFLDNLPYISNNKAKQMRLDSFERGFRVGQEEAIDALRDIQKYEYRNLNNFEKQIVIKFLQENNLEFGYDVENGGFYILKRKSN
jgi:hypothetical protein